jgi:hypothetical protein
MHGAEYYMNRVFLCLSGATLIALITAGCASGPAPAEPAKQAAPKPAAKPVSGQSALFSMYQVARTWSGDATLLRVENLPVDDIKPEPGKCGAWRAIFASLSKGQKRDYSYAVADISQSLTKGVRAGSESAYVANPQQRPFAIAFVKVDTPAALEDALRDKDIKAFAEKNPELPVQYVLEWGSQTGSPAWRVIWGNTISTSAASAFIDAESGKLLKKLR